MGFIRNSDFLFDLYLFQFPVSWVLDLIVEKYDWIVSAVDLLLGHIEQIIDFVNNFSKNDERIFPLFSQGERFSSINEPSRSI
jgi:hypothetical protein